MKQYFVSNDGTELIEYPNGKPLVGSVTAKTYPCPTPFGKHLCGLEVLEGSDFRLQLQWMSFPNRVWVDMPEQYYNSLVDYRRIIAVPTQVTEKKEESPNAGFTKKVLSRNELEETQEELWGVVENQLEFHTEVFAKDYMPVIEHLKKYFNISRK